MLMGINQELSLKLVEIVRQEFGAVSMRFEVNAFEITDKGIDNFKKMNRPGVYVYWHERYGCVKVGKSQKNVAKRALDHCGSDNTTSKDGLIQMAMLKADPACKLLFVTLAEHRESMHWIVALEYFLEKKLKPYIRSARMG